jgi:hypothetical protein
MSAEMVIWLNRMYTNANTYLSKKSSDYKLEDEVHTSITGDMYHVHSSSKSASI